jgi:hypothetical protein
MSLYAEDIIITVSDFMDENEMKFWRDYNDEILETKQPFLAIFEEGTRPVLQFGIDKCEDHTSHHTLGIVSEVEVKLRNLFDRVIAQTKETFRDRRDVYMSSMWFAKQLPGCFVDEHEDTDDGYNTQFEYSAVLYLNTLSEGGDLIFTDFDYSVKPVAGDLVIFKSVQGGMHKVNRINEDRYTMPMWMTLDPKFAL